LKHVGELIGSSTMDTLTTPKFWWLDAPYTQPLGVEIDGRKYVNVVCPTHEGHRGSERAIGNLAFKIPPSGVKDFTWTNQSDIVVNSRVLELFAKHHVTGFETRPVEVRFTRSAKTEPPELFELVVTGWGGTPALEAGVKLAEYCPDCGKRRFAIADPGRLINPAAWDGSDLFIVWPLPGFRFISDRLATILRREKVSGVNLIPAPEIRVAKGEKVSPGRLIMHMPEERARALSERFGIR
jgi:hypothetical protein